MVLYIFALFFSHILLKSLKIKHGLEGSCFSFLTRWGCSWGELFIYKKYIRLFNIFASCGGSRRWVSRRIGDERATAGRRREGRKWDS